MYHCFWGVKWIPGTVLPVALLTQWNIQNAEDAGLNWHINRPLSPCRHNHKHLRVSPAQDVVKDPRGTFAAIAARL
jgi:hypothetical protein